MECLSPELLADLAKSLQELGRMESRPPPYPEEREILVQELAEKFPALISHLIRTQTKTGSVTTFNQGILDRFSLFNHGFTTLRLILLDEDKKREGPWPPEDVIIKDLISLEVDREAIFKVSNG